MTEREALLKAVCDNPDDDTPRLVFADWLQENGEEERAEFIRAQVELAAGRADGERLAELVRRVGELREQFGRRWLGELPAVRLADWQYPGWLGREPFDRGFASHLRVKTAGALVAGAGALFAATPVRRLMVHHIMKADALARLPQLRHLHVFAARIVSRRAADELADCPHLDPVPDVRLSFTALPEEQLTRLRARFGDRLHDQA